MRTSAAGCGTRTGSPPGPLRGAPAATPSGRRRHGGTERPGCHGTAVPPARLGLEEEGKQEAAERAYKIQRAVRGKFMDLSADHEERMRVLRARIKASAKTAAAPDGRRPATNYRQVFNAPTTVRRPHR